MLYFFCRKLHQGLNSPAVSGFFFGMANTLQQLVQRISWFWPNIFGRFLCVPKNGSGAVLPTPAQFWRVQLWLWTYGFLDIIFYRESSLSKPCSPNPHFLHHPTMSVKPKVLHRAHSLHILLIPRQEPAQTSSLRSQISHLNVSIAPSIWNP